MVRLLTLCFLAISLVGCAHGNSTVYSDEGYAIGGYDTVAYFNQSQPVEGISTYTSEYSGANWRFSSQENKALFDADPEKYAPQYGGYCAYAMAKGFSVSSDPKAWTIHEDKLYLNFSLSVRETWLKNKVENVEKANKNWAEKKS